MGLYFGGVLYYNVEAYKTCQRARPRVWGIWVSLDWLWWSWCLTIRAPKLVKHDFGSLIQENKAEHMPNVANEKSLGGRGMLRNCAWAFPFTLSISWRWPQQYIVAICTSGMPHIWYSSHLRENVWFGLNKYSAPHLSILLVISYPSSVWHSSLIMQNDLSVPFPSMCSLCSA